MILNEKTVLIEIFFYFLTKANIPYALIRLIKMCVLLRMSVGNKASWLKVLLQLLLRIEADVGVYVVMHPAHHAGRDGSLYSLLVRALDTCAHL